MELEVARKFIREHMDGHALFANKALIADRYYRVQNDILNMPMKKENDIDNPMRNADNRIPHSFYQLLVNQKAGYMFTFPPLFDVKNDDLNAFITDSLGDAYAKKAKTLCINASNAGIAWVHYWMSEDNKFQYGIVPSVQCVPVWSSSLDPKLDAMLRVYRERDTETGNTYEVYEVWTDKECAAYRRDISIEIESNESIYDTIYPYFMFNDFYLAQGTAAPNVRHHDFDTVPFIAFGNNSIYSRDLDSIKALIDAYDKTYSGFMNDLEDIQEVIFILTNYGGQSLSDFLSDVKHYKTIQMDSMGADDKSGVSTLNIDIPVDARDKMLEITRKAIFDMGQGIDPQQQGLDATSGEAMKFLYALLELKAGVMETEFRLGFNQLVRVICKTKGQSVSNIIQTWTRTSIKNDSVLADMCSKSEGIVSRKTILKHHPFVDDVEDEEKQLDREEQDKQALFDSYEGTLKGGDDNVGMD